MRSLPAPRQSVGDGCAGEIDRLQREHGWSFSARARGDGLSPSLCRHVWVVQQFFQNGSHGLSRLCHMLAGHFIDESRQDQLLLVGTMAFHVVVSGRGAGAPSAPTSVYGTWKISAIVATPAARWAWGGSSSAPGCFSCRPWPEGAGNGRQKRCLCFSCASPPKTESLAPRAHRGRGPLARALHSAQIYRQSTD